MLVGPEIIDAARSGEGFRLAAATARLGPSQRVGWDSGIQSLFAQCYRNGEDDWDPPPGNRWVTPGRYPPTGIPEELAQWIAQATGTAHFEVLYALAESLGERGSRLRHLAAAA